MKPYNDLSHIPNQTFLTAFTEGYQRIQTAIEGLTEAELKQHVVVGKWSIWEIIFHVADAEIMGAARVRQAFTQSNRELAYYKPDVWADSMQYQNTQLADLQEQLQLFSLLRSASLRIFTLATAADWQKTAAHPERGDISLLTILRLYADHSERHLAQILERRKLLGKPIEMNIYFTERMY
jgi:hypothetical protein